MRFIPIKNSATVILLLFASCLYAQDSTINSIEPLLDTSTVAVAIDEASISPIPTIVINEKEIQYNENLKSALSVLIDGSPAEVGKKWKQYSKELYAISFKKSKSILIAENIRMIDIADNQLSLSVSISKNNQYTALEVAFELGGGEFITSDKKPAEFNKAKEMLIKFSKDFYISYYSALLESGNEERDDLIKQKQKILNKKSGISNSITRLNLSYNNDEKSIVDNEQKIRALQLKNDNLRLQMEGYKDQVVQAESGIKAKDKQLEIQNQKILDKTGQLSIISYKLANIK